MSSTDPNSKEGEQLEPRPDHMPTEQELKMPLSEMAAAYILGGRIATLTALEHIHATSKNLEARIKELEGLGRELVEALNSTLDLDNGCPLPTWQKGYEMMCAERSAALAKAKELIPST